MPRPKNFREESKNFGSRKSKDKQDFLGKKKTETESSLGKTSKSKDFDSAQKLKEKRISDTSEKTEEIAEQGTTNEKTAEKEYPNVDLGIDIFSQVNENSKIKDLKEKAKELEKKIEEKPDEKKLKEEIKKSEKKRSDKTLFPLDDYVKYGAHLGTKAITPDMRKYVYKRRADGLAVLNTNAIDEKLKEAADFLKDFKPEDTFLACKREAGWKAAKKFSELTGIKAFTKKYPAGGITNVKLNDFFEVELIIVCDPWLDKNALNDAIIVKKPVIALCDTNNLTNGVTKIIPCNNKAAKPIGLILYLLAREYLKSKNDDREVKLEDFVDVVEEISEEKAEEESSLRKISEKNEKEKKEEHKETLASEGV